MVTGDFLDFQAPLQPFFIKNDNIEIDSNNNINKKYNLKKKEIIRIMIFFAKKSIAYSNLHYYEHC